MKKKKQQYKPDEVDNEFMFNSLMDGMSWNKAKEQYKNQDNQNNYRQPTQKEMLADWIISKDQQDQQFMYDGHKHQLGGWPKGINPDLITDEDYSYWDLMNDAQTHNSSIELIPVPQGQVQDINYKSSIELPEDYLSKIDPKLKSFNDAEEELLKQQRLQQFQNVASGAAIIGGTILDSIGDNRNLDNINDAQQADIQRIRSFNPKFGSTEQVMSQVENMPVYKQKSLNDFGYLNEGQVATNALSKGASAFLTTPGGPIAKTFVGVGTAIASLAGDGINNSKAMNNYRKNIDDKKTGYEMAYAKIGNETDNMNNRILKNNMQGYIKAQGGYINSKSRDYPKSLTEFNTGGDHEENPNGGIQQGVNPYDGQKNLVEQGETKWNDYIYSKRIYADGGTLKANRLNDKKYAGWSYSDISKDIYKEFEERPNDPIARRTWEDLAAKLQNSQEADKLKLKQKEVDKFLNSRSEQEITALQNQMMYEIAEQDQAYQEQLYNQAAQEGLIGQDGVYANGGHMYDGGERSKLRNQTRYPEREPVHGTWNGLWSVLYEGKPLVTQRQVNPDGFIVEQKEDESRPKREYNNANYINGQYYIDGQFNTANNNNSANSNQVLEQNNNDTINYNVNTTQPYGLDLGQLNVADNNVNITQPYVVDLGKVNTSDNEATNTPRGTYSTNSTTTSRSNTARSDAQSTDTNTDIFIKPQYISSGLDFDSSLIKPNEFALWIQNGRKTTNNNNKKTEDLKDAEKDKTDNGAGSGVEDDDKNTTNGFIPNLRFAQALGSGLNYLKDIIGIQNVNDYSDADMLQRATDSIRESVAPHIGGYQQYNPVDTAYLENSARQQAAAAMRAVANSSNGNRGYVSVNNAINSYNLGNSIGSLGINAAKQDLEDRIKIAEFNRMINKIKSDNTLTTEARNQAVQEAKARLYSQIAQMRTAERYANDSARAANENAFWANFGAFGREASEINRVNANRALLYGLDPWTLNGYYKYFMDNYKELENESKKKNKKQSKNK